MQQSQAVKPGHSQAFSVHQEAPCPMSTLRRWLRRKHGCQYEEAICNQVAKGALGEAQCIVHYDCYSKDCSWVTWNNGNLFSWRWRPELQDSSVGRAGPFWGLWGRMSPSFWRWPADHGLQMPVLASTVICPLPLCIFSLSVSCKDTWHSAHLHSRWSHLKLLTLFTFAKANLGNLSTGGTWEALFSTSQH